LQVAVNSALRQTVTDIEVFIVLDGPTAETREAAIRLQDTDGRVRLFDNPKGERHGELHRHRALSHASGDIVCYLSDDDVWLPDHVANALAMLSEADFAHSLPTWVTTEGSLGVWTVDLSSDFYRALLLGGTNRIPLTTAAHTLDLYHRLPHGWRTTPEGTPTDLYMWQQILETDDVIAVSGTVPTALSFPAPDRRHMSQDERLAEMQLWETRAQRPSGPLELESNVLDIVVRDRACLSAAQQVETARYEAILAEGKGNDLKAAKDIAELRHAIDELADERTELHNQIEATRAERDQLIEGRADERTEHIGEIEAARVERDQLIEARSRAERQLRAVRASATWRLRSALVGVPGIGAAYRRVARRIAGRS
jgi:hypothetical protein